MAGTEPKPPTRFVYHAVWTVEVPTLDDPQATMAQLDPIGPGMMGRVIGMTAARILADHGQHHKVRVGAVSCTSEPDRPESRYQYQAPGPEQAKTTGTFTAQTFAVGELPMIPPPSGHVGPGRGGGRAP